MNWVSIDTPLWLLALPVVAIPALLARRRTVPSDRAHHVARWLRTVALLALVLALAGPRVRTGGDGVDVAFLFDHSDSAAGGREAARDYVEEALASRGSGDRAAIGVFGRDAQLVHGLTTDPSTDEPANVIDGSATDLERALRLGQGAVGSQRHRRVVLLTDGRQTTGDLVAAGEELAAAGVGVDVVPLDASGVADVLVDGVAAPADVRRGESYDVTVRLRNTGHQPADGSLVVRADGEVIDRRDVTVDPGTTEVAIEQVAGDLRDGEPGTVRYEAEISTAASTTAANDVARAAVRTAGPPKVLIFQRTDGLADELSRALEASDIPVDVASADRDPLPELDRLIDYDSVVLVDVAASDLGTNGLQTLETFVRDTGHGLVAIGGESSFGMGEYGGTPLEEVLPVFGQVTDPQRRPPLAEALVVDTSESMTACHCADDEVMGGEPLQSGVNKTDISKEAVARAVDALEAEDTLGVLAFNRANEWVVPLQRLPSDDVIDEGLARLQPQGETGIAQAVREAMAGLADTDARLRHIVLFTDGFTSESSEGLVDIAAEAAAEGITLSVVGTGEGPAELQQTLEDMAEAGGGRYYPGRDLASVPNIIALELRTAARNIVNEGRFVPAISGGSPATAELDATPPLLGYLATTAKPTARTVLRVGEQNDPLLATWDVGLGTTTAWLSDATTRWSAGWVDWDGYAQFWSAVVRETFPSTETGEGTLRATVNAGGVDLRVETADDLPAGARATATVTGPDGTTTSVDLDRTDLRTFAATVDASAAGLAAEGVYAVTARVLDGDEERLRLTTTAIRSYPAEYAVTAVDPGLLSRATAAESARLDPPAAAAFAAAGLPGGDARVALWPWLLATALLLAPLDVGLRRLRLERADWARVRAWMQSRRGGGDGSGGKRPRDAATDALFAAKRRAGRDDRD